MKKWGVCSGHWAVKNDEEVLRGELGSGAAVLALQCARGIGRMRGAKRRAGGIARPERARPKKNGMTVSQTMCNNKCVRLLT